MAYLDHDGLSHFWTKVKGKLGALAYKSTVAKSDLAQAVQASLGKADTALQSESDPTVPSWAKAASKPSYTYTEVGAAAASHTHDEYFTVAEANELCDILSQF